MLDLPTYSLVLCLEVQQWVPPNQPLVHNHFFLPQTLKTNPLKVILEWAHLVISGLLPLVVVVFKVATRETVTEAEVEGLTSLGGQGGVVTLNQGTLALPMYPLVGMEATQAMTEDRGMA